MSAPIRRLWRPVLGLVAVAALHPSTAAAQRQRPDSLLFGAHPAPFWALSVANLDRELAWYRDTLGFTVHSVGTQSSGARYALLQQGAALIELLQVPMAKSLAEVAPGLTDPSRLRGFFKGGMVVSDVEGLSRQLHVRGVRFAFELTEPNGGPYRVLGVRDPEGNLLQFFGP